MTLPQEITTPIMDFLKKNRWIIIIIIACIFFGYASVIFLGPDNQVEVAVEKIIEAETGITIDLTP